MIVRVRVVFRKTGVGTTYRHLTLKMTTAKVAETSVTSNSLSEDYMYSQPDDHTTDTPGFKPFFTMKKSPQTFAHFVNFANKSVCHV